MPLMHDMGAEERRRQERKFWRTGIVVSLVLHLLVFFVWRGVVIPESPFAAAGPRAGDNRAAAGSMQAINIPNPPRVPIVPPPIPIPVDVAIEPVEFVQETQIDPASVLGEAPELGEGPGKENGEGEGDGGDADEGFYRLQPPTPRGMIMPPDHKSLRGTDLQIWVFVDATGRVVADSTRLDPPTGDGGLNRQLIRDAAEWQFRPAVQEGQPVGSWFPYRISG